MNIEAVVTDRIAHFGRDPGHLLSILRDVQSAAGALTPAAIDAVAATLAIPRAQVEATATFYHLLHTRPHGGYEILFSDNVIDRMQGRPEMMAYLCDRMWLEPGKVSEDGLVYVDAPPTSVSATRAPQRS